MNKQDNLDDINSCWNKAEADEPIFVFRSTDIFAPDLIRQWADKYSKAKIALKAFGSREQEKYKEALACANAMDRFRENVEPKK